jgi:hypothetical protein
MAQSILRSRAQASSAIANPNLLPGIRFPKQVIKRHHTGRAGIAKQRFPAQSMHEFRRLRRSQLLRSIGHSFQQIVPNATSH